MWLPLQPAGSYCKPSRISSGAAHHVSQSSLLQDMLQDTLQDMRSRGRHCAAVLLLLGPLVASRAGLAGFAELPICSKRAVISEFMLSSARDAGARRPSLRVQLCAAVLAKRLPKHKPYYPNRQKQVCNILSVNFYQRPQASQTKTCQLTTWLRTESAQARVPPYRGVRRRRRFGDWQRSPSNWRWGRWWRHW